MSVDQPIEYIEYDENDPRYNDFRPINTDHVILDFTGCKTWWDIHELIKIRFGLPQYYGKNLDALWDCLRGYANEPMKVEIRGVHSLPKDAKEEFEDCRSVFDDVHENNPNMQFIYID